MKCPNCASKLFKKSIKTKASGEIEVDYCGNCGGIYFDRGEVNRISRETANKLAKASQTKHAQALAGSGMCPKCGASLKRYFGESVPQDVHVLRCPECSGTWFAPDDLTEFKKAQETKINYFKTWKIPLPSLSAVLIPIAMFITLAGVSVLTANSIRKDKSIKTRADQVLTTPSVIPLEKDGQVTIVFTTKVPAKTEIVLYYDMLGTTTIPVSVEMATSHQVVLPELTPGKEYRYKVKVVTSEDSFTSKEYSFSLPPKMRNR